MLLYYGVALPRQYDNINWSKAMIQWIEDLTWLHKPAAITMQSRLREYNYLHGEYLSVCNELRAYARTNYQKDYYLLQSVPGVGPFFAIGVLSEIGDLRRFKGIDHLSSYIGLVPSLHSSGAKTYDKL